jgi:hypothetical protein
MGRGVTWELMMWIKGASTTVRILIIAIVLILLPAAVLSYIGFMSVRERARNFETGYQGTLLLVRDRIEQEILHREQDLGAWLASSDLDPGNRDSSRQQLQRSESENSSLVPCFSPARGHANLNSTRALPATCSGRRRLRNSQEKT